jgi:hypothetical protein
MSELFPFTFFGIIGLEDTNHNSTAAALVDSIPETWVAEREIAAEKAAATSPHTNAPYPSYKPWLFTDACLAFLPTVTAEFKYRVTPEIHLYTFLL